MSSARFAARALLLAVLVGCTGAPVNIDDLTGSPTPVAAPTGALTPTAGASPTSASSQPPAVSPAASAAATASATASPMSAAQAWAAWHAWSCLRVVHTPIGTFVSYLQAGIGFYDDIAEDPADLVDYIVIVVEGANDDEPAELVFDADYGFLGGDLGLRGAGPKRIVKVEVHWLDGTITDATEAVIEDLGSDSIDVRFPEEDEFGDCSNVPSP